MVVEEVSQVEQDRYLIKAVSQCKQGAWTRWEDISNRDITWADIWRTPPSRLSFLMRAAYDTLPCPQNLSQWFGSEDKFPLCNKANAGLQHILSGCNVALTQGRFRWRHNQMLRKLAEQLERCRVWANSSSVTLHPNVPFLRPGEGGQKTVAGRTTCLLGDACWSGHPAYLSNRDHPDNIKARCCGVGHSSQEGPHYWADCAMGRGNTSGARVQAAQVLWSGGGVQRRGMDRDHPSRRSRISLRRAIKELAEEAEKASYWLWLRRRDIN